MVWEAKVWEELLSVGRVEAEWGQGGGRATGVQRQGKGSWGHTTQSGERARAWPDESGEWARAWPDGATGEEGPCKGAVWSRAHIPTSLQPDPSPLPWVALPCVLGELVTDAIGSLTELPAP